MKKASRPSLDDMRPEYDLASLGSSVRGKYAKQLKGTTLVALQPEVAKAFPTSEAVNEALRVVLKATASVRRAGRSQSARRVGQRARIDRRSGIRAWLANNALKLTRVPRSPSCPGPCSLSRGVLRTFGEARSNATGPYGS